MGIYKDTARCAPARPENPVNFAKVEKDIFSRTAKPHSIDRRDYDIMLMAVRRRAQTTHVDWVKTQRGMVAGAWDLVVVGKPTSIRWAK